MWHKRLFTIGALVGALLTQTVTLALGQQPDPVIDPLHDRVSVFFEDVSQKRFRTAYDELLGDKQLGSQEDRELLVKETEKIEDLYGEYRRFEPVYTKKVGSDLVFVKYLYKCARFPVLWHVTFYRSSANGESGLDSRAWQVVSIRFDTDLELLTLLLRDK